MCSSFSTISRTVSPQPTLAAPATKYQGTEQTTGSSGTGRTRRSCLARADHRLGTAWFMSGSPDLSVEHDESGHRFRLRRGGDEVGVLAYRPVGRPGGDVVDVYTTQIDPSARGQGLGEVLVRAALDDLRHRGRSVKASCWFVADFLAAHPDYHDVCEGAQRPTALGNVPEERLDPAAARSSHEKGLSDVRPGSDGGDPGRPRP
jgi:hypothetical protein